MGTKLLAAVPGLETETESALQEHFKLEIQVSSPGHKAPDPSSEVRQGLFYYAISSVFYALMAVSVKMAGLQGVPTWEIVFFRSLFILTVSLTTLLRDGDNPLGERCDSLLAM